jgi:hypothetical protein
MSCAAASSDCVLRCPSTPQAPTAPSQEEVQAIHAQAVQQAAQGQLQEEQQDQQGEQEEQEAGGGGPNQIISDAQLQLVAAIASCKALTAGLAAAVLQQLQAGPQCRADAAGRGLGAEGAADEPRPLAWGCPLAPHPRTPPPQPRLW